MIVWVAADEVLPTHLKRVRTAKLPLDVIFESVRLKVKELKVISSFVPLILVVVLTGSWLEALGEVVLEPWVCTELKIVSVSLRAQLLLGWLDRVLGQIRSRADSSGGSFCDFGHPWVNFDGRTSILVILPREQDKVV